jgi:DnaJ-domain-containing protein 1
MTEGHGELVRALYRLGRGAATGTLTITLPGQRPEVLVLRRGHLITSDTDAVGRIAAGRLARLAATPGAVATFDGGAALYPPGALRQLSLVAWVRHHLESQLDAGRAAQLAIELAGARLVLGAHLAPTAADDTDRRILDALAQPRRLDELVAIARAPRFRLLCFVHFLRAVGALGVTGVAAVRIDRVDPRTHARRLLGVDDHADPITIKRAYRRLARALHPDLRPDLDEPRRRDLERRFADVTAAYELLAG